jgi:hypothetical protein
MCSIVFIPAWVLHPSLSSGGKAGGYSDQTAAPVGLRSCGDGSGRRGGFSVNHKSKIAIYNRKLYVQRQFYKHASSCSH